jgi:hypothetical protein
LVKTDFTAQTNQFHTIDIINKNNDMRHARVDMAHFHGAGVHGQENPLFNVGGRRHPDFDGILQNRCVNDSRVRFKSHLIAGDMVQEGKPGRTPGAVSTHFGKTAVRVEKTPFKINGLRIFNQDKAVCAHGHFPAAYLLDHIRGDLAVQLPVAVVYENKIIPAPAHLKEVDGFHGIASPRQGGVCVRPFGALWFAVKGLDGTGGPFSPHAAIKPRHAAAIMAVAAITFIIFFILTVK